MTKKEISLTSNFKETSEYISFALNEIRTNPNHSFSKEEIAELLKSEENSKQLSLKLSKAVTKINNDLKKGTESFKLILSNIAERNLKDIKNIASLGWYISPDLVSKYTFSDLSNFSQKDNLKSFEFEIIKTVDNKVLTILEDCVKYFPKRKLIFYEIIKLYNNEYYYSLINLCYSQADGICNETWGFGFFDKKNKTNQLKAYQEFSENNIGFSSFFAEQLDITENEITMWSKNESFNNQEKVENSFNRHHILHGHSGISSLPS